MTRQQRRIGAYGICRAPSGAVLLARGSVQSGRPGTWFLPGGGIAHGEHPEDAVIRETAEETGLAVTVVRARDVAAEVVAHNGYQEHTDGVIYDLAVTGGTLRPEIDGTTDGACWITPDELPTLRLSGLAAYAFGLAPAPSRRVPPPPRRPGPPRRGRGQRFAVYGLATDPAGRVLLTLISDGFPGAGRWHLPGGGTDFGEQPADALRREIIEESAQQAQIGKLLEVTHRHHTSGPGPAREPVDWHSVRAIYQVTVAEPTTPRVLDVGGSTAAAGWFTRDQVQTLPLTDLAAALLVSKT